jgi:hypothetical protein
MICTLSLVTGCKNQGFNNLAPNCDATEKFVGVPSNVRDDTLILSHWPIR